MALESSSQGVDPAFKGGVDVGGGVAEVAALGDVKEDGLELGHEGGLVLRAHAWEEIGDETEAEAGR